MRGRVVARLHRAATAARQPPRRTRSARLRRTLRGGAGYPAGHQHTDSRRALLRLPTMRRAALLC